ncbi:Avirulence AvrBs3 [Gossypium arboreum]|uniref:Avirulence AvrBs3 n=1 Tax=Gossypium arboreum TaxID=29729 RepID=A0A0B0P500_GOSAR|nr:Avirulence AvrBs3 [Gossypium arboreum]
MGKVPMPCPRHGLTLTIEIEADAMSQKWSYTSSHISVPMPCPRHGLTMKHVVADACPKHVLHWLTSQGRCMFQTCLTLALISMPMPCPRHGLTLALIMWPMPVPDMSYTGTQITMSWHEYPINFLRFKWDFYYLNIHHT